MSKLGTPNVFLSTNSKAFEKPSNAKALFQSSKKMEKK